MVQLKTILVMFSFHGFYTGTLVLGIPVSGLIIQAREKNGGSTYGYFTYGSPPLSAMQCPHTEVSINSLCHILLY